jgi:hypothetical protein
MPPRAKPAAEPDTEWLWGDAVELAGGGQGAQKKTYKQPTKAKIPGHGEVELKPLEPVSDAYRKFTGRPYNPMKEFPEFDEGRAARIAEAYERMKHDPADPKVKRSYEAMIDETLGQYRALKDSGYEFEFIKPGEGDPYAASPALGYLDLRDRGHMFVFPTESGFGTLGELDVAGNPLLRRVGRVGDLGDATANDAFRIVHDMYGHFGPGNPFFRHKGEERAWLNHSGMYSPEAIPAMTSETRGQNSWLNFGPHGPKNRTASSADTIFADQKSGIMEPFTWDETGFAGGGRVKKETPLNKTLKRELFPNSNPRRDAYVRFGEWPANERSARHIEPGFEQGVSVYPLHVGRNGAQPEVPLGGPVLDLWDRLASDEPRFLVEGRRVGRGLDNEPVLRDVEALGPYHKSEGLYDLGPNVDESYWPGNTGVPLKPFTQFADDFQKGGRVPPKKGSRNVEFVDELDKIFGEPSEDASAFVRMHTEKTGKEGAVFGNEFFHTPLIRGHRTGVDLNAGPRAFTDFATQMQQQNLPYFSVHSHPVVNAGSKGLSIPESINLMERGTLGGPFFPSAADMSIARMPGHTMMIESAGIPNNRLAIQPTNDVETLSGASRIASGLRDKYFNLQGMGERLRDFNNVEGLWKDDMFPLDLYINQRMAEEGAPILMDARTQSGRGGRNSVLARDLLPEFKGYLQRHNAEPF